MQLRPILDTLMQVTVELAELLDEKPSEVAKKLLGREARSA